MEPIKSVILTQSSKYVSDDTIQGDSLYADFTWLVLKFKMY